MFPKAIFFEFFINFLASVSFLESLEVDAQLEAARIREIIYIVRTQKCYIRPESNSSFLLQKNNLISGIHSFMSMEDEKYKYILPPLTLLTKDQEKKMMLELKDLDFYPEKNIAA